VIPQPAGQQAQRMGNVPADGFAEAKRRWSTKMGSTQDVAGHHAVVDCQSVATRIFTGHAHKVACCAVDEEYQMLYTASHDEITGMVRQWSIGDGALVREFEAFQDAVTALAASDGAVFVALGGRERIAVRMCGESGQRLQCYLGHGNGLAALEVHPSRKWLFTGSQDHCAMQYHVMSGNRVRALKGHTGTVRAIASEEQWVFTSGDDCTIWQWGLALGDHMRTLEGHSSSVTSMWASGGKVYSASQDDTIRVWTVDPPSDTTNTLVFAHPTQIVDMVVIPLPDGHGFVEAKMICTASPQGLLHCVSPTDGAVRWQLDLSKDTGLQPPETGQAPPVINCISFSTAGSLVSGVLYAACMDGNVREVELHVPVGVTEQSQVPSDAIITEAERGVKAAHLPRTALNYEAPETSNISFGAQVMYRGRKVVVVAVHHEEEKVTIFFPDGKKKRTRLQNVRLCTPEEVDTALQRDYATDINRIGAANPAKEVQGDNNEIYLEGEYRPLAQKSKHIFSHDDLLDSIWGSGRYCFGD